MPCVRRTLESGRAGLDPGELRWDLCVVAGSSDDSPARGRGAVRPPPSLVPDDGPASIEVPRMEPPPPSLEAMVASRPRSSRREREAGSSWWLWLVLVVVAAAVTAYVTR
jgi:hypothetical protein